MAEKHNRTPIDVMIKQCEDIGLEYITEKLGLSNNKTVTTVIPKQ